MHFNSPCVVFIVFGKDKTCYSSIMNNVAVKEKNQIFSFKNKKTTKKL